MVGRRGIAFTNKSPMEQQPDRLPSSLAKAEFGRRLNRLMVLKGWNQSELARRGTAIAPPGVKLTRDLVSKYIRGLVFPNPVNLDLLCRALECEVKDLIPSKGVPEVGDNLPPFDLQETGEGMAWLRVNKMVTLKQASAILRILGESDDHGS